MHTPACFFWYNKHTLQDKKIQDKNKAIMKKIYKQTLRCALAMLVALFAFANMAWAQTGSTREQVNIDQSVGAGFTLQPGKMYIVRSNMELNATSGNGLNVAPKGSGQAPILYIPADVTVTVKGANASGTTGAGAGIYVPSNAELIITGAGTLIATGGNAANGGNGENGHNGGNGNFDVTSEFQAFNINDDNASRFVSGAGGKGGNGGGGAGAGIGGIGGQGGQGGDGGASVKFNGTSGNNGKDGSAGSAGSAGATMGKVSIMGTVKVTATGGAAGTVGGAAGTQGYCMRSNLYNVSYRLRWCGAGGGGAGGGAGYEAPGIGAGGRGAGGGAGGGSGATGLESITTNAHTGDNYVGRASSATGGGVGNVSGLTATNDKGRDTGSPSGTSACSTKAGNGSNSGGAAGAEPTMDSHGWLYVATGATVTYGSGSFGGNTGTEPEDMQITITFKNNEYAATRTEGGEVAKDGTVGTLTLNIGESLPAAALNTYKLAAKAQESPEKFAAEDKYFAGYYTAENGRGTRAYKGIGTTNLDIANNNIILSENTTLYAHFVNAHHVVNWDYTYSNGVDGSGTSTWVNLRNDQWLKQGKLTFYRRNAQGERESFKSIVMNAVFETPTEATADYVKNNFYWKQNPTAGAGNHTRVEGNIYLKVRTASETDQLNSNANIEVYFTDDELISISDYEFEPWTGYVSGSSDGTKADNWSVINDQETKHTVFSFTGAQDPANQFVLKWNVTLSGLKVYPDHIYVKPLYNAGTEQTPNWALISQLPVRYDGVSSSITSQVKNDDPAHSSVTYSGEYPVWIHDANSVEYDNKVGLVGFTLNNKMYYMDEVHGDVRQYDMQSTQSIKYSTVTSPEHTITMTVPASSIPVLRLMPNGGKLSDSTPAIVVNETRTGTFDLSQYIVTKDGYKLKNWTTEENGTGTAYAPNTTNVPGTGAITLYAQWDEAIVPVFHPQRIDASTEPSHLVLIVTDNVGVTGLSYITSTTDLLSGGTKDVKDLDWNNATTVSLADQTGNPSVNVNIPSTSASYTYFYFKATDAAGNDTYAASPQMKTDLKNPTYEIYPEGNVCNFNVQITVMDNIQIASIKYAQTENELTNETKDAQEVTWNDVSFTAGENKSKTFVVTKLSDVNDKCPDGEASHKKKVISLRITDAAGNVTEYLNHTHMYYDHAWDTSTEHHAMVLNTSTGKYVEHTYYNCKHGCGHIWDTTVCGDVNTYAHEYTGPGSDNPTTKQQKEQGLMRSETTDYLEGSGSVVISTNEGIIGIANDINNAITTIAEAAATERTITLIDDTKVDNASGASLSNPGNDKKVTIDLNGQSLYTKEAVGETQRVYGNITGNANVIILLNDNGVTNYTNKSQVSGSPIKYHRTFAAATRAGKWQALYLPFDAGTVSAPDGVTYTFGIPASVNITSDKAELNITKGTTSLAANTHYFVKSSNGEVLIELPYSSATSPVLPAAESVHTSTVSTNYQFKGSLTDDDNKATAEKSYWILTNGGSFTMAKAGSHQRPYHWVIYDKTPAPQGAAKPISMVIVEIDDITAAETVVDAAGAALSGDVYSISGMKMPKNAKLPQGIYISNGKKFHVK